VDGMIKIGDQYDLRSSSVPAINDPGRDAADHDSRSHVGANPTATPRLTPAACRCYPVALAPTNL